MPPPAAWAPCRSGRRSWPSSWSRRAPWVGAEDRAPLLEVVDGGGGVPEAAEDRVRVLSAQAARPHMAGGLGKRDRQAVPADPAEDRVLGFDGEAGLQEHRSGTGVGALVVP